MLIYSEKQTAHRGSDFMGRTIDSKFRLDMLTNINKASENLNFQIENTITDEITNGNVEVVKDTLTKVSIDEFIEELINAEESEKEALRVFKNTLISINTFCRIAAKNGEVIPLTLYLVYQRYIMLIEYSKSFEFLRDNVFYKMPTEYSEIVDHYSTRSYSETMTNIVYEISQNLTENLTLKEIASNHDMHPVHLARKFKTETGITFIAYINELRIDLAKYYFHLNEYRLNEVVHLSGFNSHSYFTKVFKKITGQTPTKYIKQLPFEE